MSVKVSVVVPVYNPGDYIDKCIESLLGQTLPAEELELIFVDDGSTDETPARLDALAEQHDHVRVIHIPNSGWPGKPRNVGVDAAHGEYIQYVDQDDFMTPDALRRLYELGHRNSADIVIGKVVSNWRTVPSGVWRTTRERVTIRDFNLWDSLTPHKMFRKAFLDEEKIRFPEGKRRLEDQLYMMQSYFPAKVVSILGDYTCYYYWRRTDKQNAGSAPIEPVGYYDNLRDVLDVVEENTEPGRFRDTIMRRFFRSEMLGRLNDRPLLRYDPKYRETLFEEVRKLTLERIEDSVVAELPALQRMRSTLVREGRLDDLIKLAGRSTGIKPRSRIEQIDWSDGRVKLSFAAELRDEQDEPFRLRRTDDGTYLDPELSAGLLDWHDGRIDAERRRCRVEVAIRHREAATEWTVPSRTQVHIEDEPANQPADESAADGAADSGMGESESGESESGEGRPVRAYVRASLTIDPNQIAGGKPLRKGVWDIWVRVVMLGFDQRIRLGTTEIDELTESAAPAVIGRRPTVVVPFFTEHGNFSLDINRRNRTIGVALEDRVPTPQPSDGRRLELTLPIASQTGSAPMPVRVVFREADKTGVDSTPYVLPAKVAPGARWARLVVDTKQDELPPAGRWRLSGWFDEEGVPEVELGFVRVDKQGRAYLEGAPRTTGLASIARRMGRKAAARPGIGRTARQVAGPLPTKWREQLKSAARRLRD